MTQERIADPFCHDHRGGHALNVRELPPRGRQGRGTTRALESLVHVPAALWECWAPSYWWTYQRHCGMLGPVTLVVVPAASCDRWAQGFDEERVPPAGQPTRELVDRETVVFVR